jgi:hypothetical protein
VRCDRSPKGRRVERQERFGNDVSDDLYATAESATRTECAQKPARFTRDTSSVSPAERSADRDPRMNSDTSAAAARAYVLE